MSLETYTGYIPALVDTNPEKIDPKSEGDDHLRGIKSTLSVTFAGFTETNVGVSVTASDINAVCAGGAESAMPTGMVSQFAMVTPPTGWLSCDGSIISRTTYANLFAAIGTTFGAGDGSTTFGIPDLRGWFTRGWVSDGTMDLGRVFGSTQIADNQEHSHLGSTLNSTNTPVTATDGAHVHSLSQDVLVRNLLQQRGNDQGNGTSEATVTALSAGDHTHTIEDYTHAHIILADGTEGRPNNVALLYCIKT
jgi:microcystin-dependent protein